MDASTSDADLVRRNLALVKGITSEREAGRRLGVSARKLKEWREGNIRGIRGPMRSKLLSNLQAPTESAPVAPLDEWGATNARTMERLAALLEKDQVIIELRARAELLRLEIEARALSEPTDDQQLGAQGARSIAEAERLERAASARERSAGRKGARPGHGRGTASP